MQKRETLRNKILENVGLGSRIYTDQHVGYEGLNATRLFVHETVNHMMSGSDRASLEDSGSPSPPA
jgi:hypothetical protein